MFEEFDDSVVEVLSGHCANNNHHTCPDKIELSMEGIVYLVFKCSCPCHNKPNRKIKKWNTKKQLDKFVKKLKKGKKK